MLSRFRPLIRNALCNFLIRQNGNAGTANYSLEYPFLYLGKIYNFFFGTRFCRFGMLMVYQRNQYCRQFRTTDFAVHSGRTDNERH